AASARALQLRELRFRAVERRLVLDRALEHLHGLDLVALLRADLAEVVEDLALRDPGARVEALEEQRAERLLRAFEIVRLEREDAEIAEHGDRARIDLEGHVELRERDVFVAELRERLAEAMMVERELFRAAVAERRDDLLEDARGVALAAGRRV